MSEIYSIPVGYLFAILIGHFFVRLVTDAMWKETGWDGKSYDDRPAYYQPRLVGIIERALYVMSFQIGKPEFIGLWLALKIAGQWHRWGAGSIVSGRKIEGRVFYNIFLVGSGLSIIYAATGAKLIEFLKMQKWQEAFILPIVLIIMTLIFMRLIYYYQRKFPTPDKNSIENENISQPGA